MDIRKPGEEEGPCAGMRVIDFSTVVSGPLCAQILGDLGADVIKVEEPRGDFSRLAGPPVREGLSGFFAHFNRNKRGVVIDLKKERGQKLAAYMLPDLVIPEAFVPSEPRTEGGLDIFRTFETRDGHAVGIVIEDRQFVGLARALDREDLIDKPEYKTVVDRISRGEELFAVLETEIRKWTTEELVTRARAHGAPFAPVNDIAAFFEDPQVVHNGTFFEAHDPRGGSARYLRHPSRFSATPASLRRHPPRLGEHTTEVLEAAGFSPETIASLRDEGAVV